MLVADIGATGMRVGLRDLTGAILDEVELTISVTDGPTVVLGVVKREFSALLMRAGAGPETVLGVGISVPGPVDTETGQVVHPPIMTGWDGYDIPGWFRATTTAPSSLTRMPTPWLSVSSTPPTRRSGTCSW